MHEQWPDSATFWRDKRVVVTGGSGFLGAFVVDKLRTRDAAEVIVPRRQDHDPRDIAAIRRLFPTSTTVNGWNSIFPFLVNLNGPRDNFDLETSHVIPALLCKCLEAKGLVGEIQEFTGVRLPCKEPETSDLVVEIRPGRRAERREGHPGLTAARGIIGR